MTACFAGPFFNILMGLGLGFSRLLATVDDDAIPVKLSASVVTGFVFLALNSATILGTGLFFGQGRIPKNYGYIALSLYSVYLVSAVGLQYSKWGREQI